MEEKCIMVIPEESQNVLDIIMAVALIEGRVNAGDLKESVLKAVKKDAKNMLKNKCNYDRILTK